VFSGGGVKGLSFIGVVQEMEKHGMIDGIMNFIGTSAGSIMCLMLVCGYSSTEMIEFVRTLSSKDILCIDLESIMEFPKTYGLDNDMSLKETLKKILLKKGYHHDITFLELVKSIGKNLIVTASNLQKKKIEYFSVDTHPNVSILYAIMASCCIPILYRPVQINKFMYVDGGMYKNFPIDYFRDDHETIGFTIKTAETTVTSNFFSYIWGIIDSVLDSVYKSTTTKRKNVKMCEIRLPEIGYQFDYEDFQVDVGVEERMSIIECGRVQFADYIISLTADSMASMVRAP
jgi:predicted acylesterase/phospholipase RssA